VKKKHSEKKDDMFEQPHKLAEGKEIKVNLIGRHERVAGYFSRRLWPL